MPKTAPGLIATVFLSLVVLCPMAGAQDQAQPLARVIPYQGRLEFNGKGFDGTKTVVFRLYLDAAGCQAAAAPVWSQSRSIEFQDGRFFAQLEDDQVPPDEAFERLLQSQEAYLSIEIEDADGAPLLLTGCQGIRPNPYAHRSAGDFPIGTVIDWYRPPNSLLEVPDGYQICNGDPVDDPRSPLDGTNTPDLVDRFVLGVGSEAEIGGSGGTDDLPDYDAASLNHVHRWATYNVANHDWYSYNSSGTSTLAFDWGDGIHNTGTGQYPIFYDGLTVYYTSHPRGNWTAEAAPQDGGTGANVPSYVGLLRLIRIY